MIDLQQIMERICAIEDRLDRFEQPSSDPEREVNRFLDVLRAYEAKRVDANQRTKATPAATEPEIQKATEILIGILDNPQFNKKAILDSVYAAYLLLSNDDRPIYNEYRAKAGEGSEKP